MNETIYWVLPWIWDGLKVPIATFSALILAAMIAKGIINHFRHRHAK